MAVNCLRLLEARGVSVWQDEITRREVTSGELKKRIVEDGLSGVLSNPAILHTAVSNSTDYDATIARLTREGKDPPTIVDDIIVEDVRDAADVLLPVWEQTNGRDGFACIDAPIWLTYDSDACIVEAHRLWDAVDRPNLMITVPGSVEAIPAIWQCLVDGLNINVGLLSSVEGYTAVVEAYLDAIETRLVRGLSVDRVASVASFLVNPVDSIVNRTIETLLKTTSRPATRAKLEGLVGKIAIANAKLAYARFAEVFSPADDRWDKLLDGGAQPQRLLWTGMTMTEPSRRDVLYVEELIAPHTVVTLSPATLAAFREHGAVRGDTATEGIGEARKLMQALCDVGVDAGYLSRQLEDEAVDRLKATYTILLDDVTLKGGAGSV